MSDKTKYEPKSESQIVTDIRLICADLNLSESMFYKDGAHTVLNDYYVPILIAYVRQRALYTAQQKELAEAREAIPQWISVRDSKPVILQDGESESVLACTRMPLSPKGEYEYHILMEYVKYTWHGWIWCGDERPVGNQITHWQPLPAPPTPEK
jgi:hypothetical protein